MTMYEITIRVGVDAETDDEALDKLEKILMDWHFEYDMVRT